MYTCLMQGLTILEFFFTMPPYCIILCTYYKHGVDRNNDHNTDHNIHWMFCIYMNNICIMLHLWDHVSWFVCVLFLSGLHPCIPRRTWSQEWGRFNGLYCCCQSLKKIEVIKDPDACLGPWILFGSFVENHWSSSNCRVLNTLFPVPGDQHRTGTRQTTGYMSWTKGYRTGQRWETLVID